MRFNPFLYVIRWLLALLLAQFIFLAVTSCSPAKRLHRLLKKYPELSQTDTLIFRDTVRIADTIRITIPAIHADTSFSILQLEDTAHIEQGKLSISIWKDPFTDSIGVSATVEADTVFYPVYFEIPIEKKIPVEKIIYRRPRDALRWYGLILFTIVLGILHLKNVFTKWTKES